MDRRGFFGACAAAIAAPQCELPVRAARRFKSCKIDLIMRDETDAWPEPYKPLTPEQWAEKARYKEGVPISLCTPRSKSFAKRWT